MLIGARNHGLGAYLNRIDDTSSKKGHEYVTLAADLDERR